ncbi:unnamed protein product [Eruca vesicaria subsp. sativa]|uniref:Uncharacterized protein n=1 Tax=Eruca vesicaria subsp. sativa TaxID=29727 RepID=A0ABC8IWZ9_ERUVS|nr:unnamed protein product [Eruca vesicaria subsp. sativa]
MDRALTSRFEIPSTISPLHRRRTSVAITRRFTPAIVSAKRSPIDGVSEELNLIASEELDQAPARRRVRSAFADLQLQLDHCLFKKAPGGIRTEEVNCDLNFERCSYVKDSKVVVESSSSSCVDMISGMREILKGRRFSASVGCRRPELKSKRRCVSVMAMAVLALSYLMA